jgi:hypothetical protein
MKGRQLQSALAQKVVENAHDRWWVQQCCEQLRHMASHAAQHTFNSKDASNITGWQFKCTLCNWWATQLGLQMTGPAAAQFLSIVRASVC